MTPPRGMFIPARVTNVWTYAPGHVRKVALTLPDTVELDGRAVPVRDRMRPGAAFLVQPFGVRTHTYRRRMYTRTNCADDSPRVLETIINDTRAGKSDTSTWWQTGEPERLWRTGGSLGVRVDYHAPSSELVVYQNSAREACNNLILESDRHWPGMPIVAVALGTGITPFLAYIRYMKARAFGAPGPDAREVREIDQGGRFSLIVSVSDRRLLMEHQALCDLAADYPHQFSYHPVLTREWPEDWPWTTGRIMRVRSPDHADGARAETACVPDSSVSGDHAETMRVDLAPLMALERDLHTCHLRFCGNATARDQLVLGLAQAGVAPRSFRSEVW